MARVPGDATAFARRGARFMTMALAAFGEGEDGTAERTWADRSTWRCARRPAACTGKCVIFYHNLVNDSRTWFPESYSILA